MVRPQIALATSEEALVELLRLTHPNPTPRLRRRPSPSPSPLAPQVERHEELVTSGMRTARALEKLPEADTCTKLEEFVRATLKGGKLADKYAAVCAEGAGPADAEL